MNEPENIQELKARKKRIYSNRVYTPEQKAHNKFLDRRRHLQVKSESPWEIVYTNIKRRVNNDLGYKGIVFTVTQEDIKELWLRDKAYLLKRPSIDRRNNKLGYIKSNLQFIELSVNSVKDKIKNTRTH